MTRPSKRSAGPLESSYPSFAKLMISPQEKYSLRAMHFEGRTPAAFFWEKLLVRKLRLLFGD
jgi:hypothetical protein